MLKLISKFPYITIVKGSYEKVLINNNGDLNQRQKDLIKHINGIMSVDNVPINKIRYVFESTFQYDIDNNKINPRYEIIRPINFRKQRPDIEINKPENCIDISIGEFINIDDSDTIKAFIKFGHRGIVIYINENNFNGCVGIVNLMEAIEETY